MLTSLLPKQSVSRLLVNYVVNAFVAFSVAYYDFKMQLQCSWVF